MLLLTRPGAAPTTISADTSGSSSGSPGNSDGTSSGGSGSGRDWDDWESDSSGGGGGTSLASFGSSSSGGGGESSSGTGATKVSISDVSGSIVAEGSPTGKARAGLAAIVGIIVAAAGFFYGYSSMKQNPNKLLTMERMETVWYVRRRDRNVRRQTYLPQIFLLTEQRGCLQTRAIS